jgi:hypothetical protein
MRISYALGIVAGLANYASAATSFAGSNLYYAAGLTQSQQTTLFTGLKDAGVQVLRVWLDGEPKLSRNVSLPLRANTSKAKVHLRRARR